MGTQNRIFGWLPCPVVFVSTASGDKRDIMTGTAMFVSEKEPLVAVSLSKSRITSQLIEEAGEFVIAIASTEQAELAENLGRLKGSEVDKFEKLSIEEITTKDGKPTIPAGSAAWMICRVESKEDVNGYRHIIARVVEQVDLGKPPMVWHQYKYFSLNKI